MYFRTFSKSREPLPKLSLIPTCHFGDESKQFWETEDYNYNLVTSNVTYPDYSKNTGMKKDFYKYSKCRDFAPRPTDSGICHTFNGLELGSILKESSWLNVFNKAFPSARAGGDLKSLGIEKEQGFAFTLGEFLCLHNTTL